MNTSSLLSTVLLTLTLSGCFRSAERDEDDDGSTGGGGWDLGTDTGTTGDGGGVNWDGGGMGGTIDSDGGGTTDGGTDGGTGDGGGTSDGGADGGTSGTDADGDGWTAEAGDCDDGDDEINPGAHEVQDDGVDSDCDGWDDEWSGISYILNWEPHGTPGVLFVSTYPSTAGSFFDYIGFAREIEGSCEDPRLRVDIYNLDTTTTGEGVGLVDCVDCPYSGGSSADDWETTCSLVFAEGSLDFIVYVW